jgi:hypothetical protein
MQTTYPGVGHKLRWQLKGTEVSLQKDIGVTVNNEPHFILPMSSEGVA